MRIIRYSYMETFNNTDLLEPLLLYRDRLKDAFHNNAEAELDDLTKKANVNVDENQRQCKIYYKEKAEAEKLTKTKNWRVFFLIMTILVIVGCFIAGVVLIMKAAKEAISMGVGIGVGIALIIAGTAIIFLAISLGKKIAQLKKLIEEHLKKAEEAKNKAWEIIKPLYRYYEYNMAAELFSKTTPLIQLDKTFDPEKFQYLHEKYGYNEYHGTDVSTIYVQSGSILGNPFVFEKNYVQTMRDHVYSGTLTITWTERVSDGKGGYHTVTRTQVLTAHYTAPEPTYYLDTWLIYGNEAAPKLSFSRYPTKINDMSDKQIESYIRHFDKKLDKEVAKDLKKGDGSFTRLANEEFEALFNSLDRDNETEFRLLFTPLGQKNMIALLRAKEVAFGDDFIFKKKKKLNFIKSQHMQGSDSLDKNPEDLQHFDYKIARQMFVDYCDKYLKDVYFDLAPLISIPLYQQHKTLDYIYDGKFNHNITQAEVESAANSHKWDLFKHPATRSLGVILKSRFLKTAGESDVCAIDAHSFSGTDRVAYVPTMGGDGRMHNVPVRWIEYNPIMKTTNMVVSNTHKGRMEFQEAYQAGQFNGIVNQFAGSHDILYKKRLFSFVLKDNNK